ncbi:MAG: hypothetical protein QM767_04610 [Anaeromyxobacter sp.]
MALALTRTRVTATDLGRIPGLAAAEREALERVIANVPEFVSAFETPASAIWVGSQRIAPPAAPPPPALGQPAPKLGVSIAVARRPRLFKVTSLAADRLVLSGEEPLPENRVLEAKVYAQEPFTMWVVTLACQQEGAAYTATVQPFALSGPAREGWDTLTAPPA